MTFDAKNYSIKYSILYSLIIALILIAPLYVYTILMQNINEAKTEIELQNQLNKIIISMESFNPKQEKFFKFPRFNSYQAGLYDKNFNPIFTLIEKPPQSYRVGYNIEQKKRYYILDLKSSKYFGAKYLIILKEYNSYQILKTSIYIFMLIVIILFFLSFIILNNFAEPFKRFNQMLDSFIKDSMHEINTPLSIINVNIDLYYRRYGENKYLKRIKSASKTLATIYNDMDYLIKKDRLEYEKEKLNFSKFIKYRIDYFSEIANLRNIEIISSIELNLEIFFNRIELERIVDNNLSNAIKYSFENSIIEIILKDRITYIELTFVDYGVGIENPNLIFKRFYREDLAKGGFGIGLNIVKNIIDKEGVKLKIESKLNEGSRFIYKFYRD